MWRRAVNATQRLSPVSLRYLTEPIHHRVQMAAASALTHLMQNRGNILALESQPVDPRL